MIHIDSGPPAGPPLTVAWSYQWDGVLTAEEMDALTNGAEPWTVRPDAFVGMRRLPPLEPGA